MSALGDIVHDFLARHGLPTPGQHLLVAVSGGVDSMVLLDALLEAHLPLHVAHFDHATRGGASAQDAVFVVEHCIARGIPCTAGKWTQDPGETGSFEMRARRARYDFLLATARQHACSAILLAHHADDQAETVLFRAVRGTGPEGIAGMAPLREERGVLLARPLLAVSRAEIEAHARAQGVVWREDATNTDLHHQRNRVRHALMPAVRELNPRAAEALTRLADSMRCENALLESLTADALAACQRGDALDRAAFRAQPEALQRRVLRAWLQPEESRNDHALVVAAAAFVRDVVPGKRLSLGPGHLLHAAADTVHLVSDVEASDASAALSVPGTCDFLGQHFTATILPHVPSEDLRAYCGPHRQVFDADALGARLTLRTRRDGDRFTPLGMTQEKKLQDYLIDRHVAQPLRDRVPLLLDEHGAIAWVVGHGPSASCAVRAESARCVVVEVTPCA